MSLSSDRSTVTRIQKEIAVLQRRQADEMKKSAEATKSMNSAMSSASRASSPSMARTYLNRVSSESKKIETAQSNAARLANDISRKNDELERARARVISGEEKAWRDQDRAITKLQTQNKELLTDLSNLKEQMTDAIELQASSTKPFVVENSKGRDAPYDFFISHAWADKEDFVDGLVTQAEAAGLDVWYDKAALAWGDSLRQKIDEGLRSAYFGVVVLSPNFFDRPWPAYELDGIVQRDLSGSGRLLPIWHRLTQDDVSQHAPSLAGRLALQTSMFSTEQIVKELKVMRDNFKAAAR